MLVPDASTGIAPAVDTTHPVAAVARGRRRRREIAFWIAVGWIALLVLVAVFAPLLPIRGYDSADFANTYMRPFTSWSEPLGTDELGRSMLSRIIYGARVSLAVGVLAVAIGMLVGTALGVVAAYFRGMADRIISLIGDSMIAFPPLVLLLAMVTILERSLQNIVLALAILIAPSFLRLARANALVLSEREYVSAAVVMGAGRLRIILREIVPNVMIALLAYAPVVVAIAIVAEGSLAFLGLSVPPPLPSWGGMINIGRTKLDKAIHLTYIPGVVLVLTVLAFNWIGRGLQSRLDPRQSALK